MAAAEELAKDRGRLGIRISPVNIKTAEAPSVVSDAIEVLGKKIHVAVSVPGVVFDEKERSCLAPDYRAAEKATAWRNSVRVADDEHILYVSVERHGKAGGLQDCLFPLEESTLRATLVEWASDPKSGLPPGLGEALRDSGIAGRVSSSTLCAYVTAVLAESKKMQKWEAAGKNLPILGFAADSRLRATDAVERLRINSELVKKAGAAEGRHQALSARSEIVSNLAGALRLARTEDMADRLSAVDLGSLTTGALEKARTPEKKRPLAKAPSRASVAPSRPPKRDAKPVGPRKPAPLHDVADTATLDAAFEFEGAEREESLESRAKKLLEEAPLWSTEQAKSGQSATDQEEKAGVWSAEMHRREFGRTSGLLPSGVEDVITELAKRGGVQLTWHVQKDPRSCLVKLPGTLAVVEEKVEFPSRLRTALGEWSDARQTVIDRLMPGGGRGPLLSFVAAPLTALGASEFRTAVRALLERTMTLYREAEGCEGDEVPRLLLSQDTARFVDKSGLAVVLLSPFHPLWLGQVLSRFEGMLAEPTLEREGRRLLARSLTEAPAAPQTWPAEKRGLELRLGRPEGGLIVYEAEPTSADDDTLRFVGERLVLQYLDLLPHSRFGLRVAVIGEGVSPLVEGIALAAERTTDLRRVELLHSGPGLNLEGRATTQEVSAGRIVLRPIPTGEGDSDYRPHLVVRIVPPPVSPAEEEGSIPEVPIQGAGSGLLPTEFQVQRTGLRARIPLDGHPVLERVEALHAIARGRTPQRAFVSDATVTSLSTVFPTSHNPAGAWQIALGRRLGRRPPGDNFLLAHERVSESEHFVAITDNVNPVSRALEGGFRKLGVNDLRPSTLRALATRLAAASATGLLALGGAGDHLIAAGLLGLALRRDFGRDVGCVLAPLERAAASTLLGGVPSEGDAGAMSVAIGVEKAKLRLVLGFATLSASPPADLVRGQLGGELGEQFSRLNAVIALATKSSSLGGLAAREALNWLLWPAIAAAEAHAPELIRLVQGLGKGTEVSVSVLCLFPPSSPLTSKRGESKVGKTPVQILSLDLPLFEELVLSAP